jgi:hypothetical protein
MTSPWSTNIGGFETKQKYITLLNKENESFSEEKAHENTNNFSNNIGR